MHHPASACPKDSASAAQLETEYQVVNTKSPAEESKLPAVIFGTDIWKDKSARPFSGSLYGLKSNYCLGVWSASNKYEDKQKVYLWNKRVFVNYGLTCVFRPNLHWLKL